MAQPCNALQADKAFGPGYSCGQFDFTLAFEQSIFGIGISSFFLLLVPLRFWGLYGSTVKLSRNWIYFVKIALAIVVVALQATNLALWAKQPLTQYSIATAALELLGSLAIVALIAVEHNRLTRPAKLTSIYLLATITADFVIIRTLYLRNYVPTLAAVLCATAAVKFVLLVFESLPKTPYLIEPNRPYGKVDLAGPFNKGLLFWLNPLLVLGNRQILTLQDLYPLNHELYSDELRVRMEAAWEKNKHRPSYPLVVAGMTALKWPLLATVIPRAAMIAISYAQTFFITAAINYLETPPALRNVNHAYGLIGAAAIIYTGTAILNANYLYKVFRMITMFRGSTASLIYLKALSADANHNQMAAVTLMSTDIDRIAMSLIQVTELWAQVTQIALGIWLLWRQLGPVAIAPTIIAVLCFIGQSQLAKRMGPNQGEWVKSVQRRVGVTSSVLRSMKSVKLAGLASSMGKLLQEERVRELSKALKFRRLLVFTNAVSSLPTLIASLVVFAAFSIQAKIQHTAPLGTAQAFTSLSILALLTQPAMMLLMSLPQVAAATGCIKRVQNFLKAEGFEDQRLLSSSGSDHPGSTDEKDSSHGKDYNEKEQPKLSVVTSSDKVVSVNELVIAPSTDKDSISRPPISFDAAKGTTTMILGPVGCGKSTLLKALLGELNPKSGSVGINTPFVGYCSQSPWLQNATIRQNIIGANEFDRDWYRTIVHLCALEEDLAQMPQKDLSLIGSRGITLSGGQKHRVALARALYSRCSVLVLDDFLSSIDRKTQRFIVHALFSKDGYAYKQGTTIILATHITAYVHLADSLVVMDEKGVLTYTGPPANWESDNKNGTTDKEEDPHKSLTTLEPEDYEEDFGDKEIKSKFDDNIETTNRQKGDFGVWKYYGNSIGWPYILFTGICICINVFGNNFQKLWLQWNTGKADPSLGLFLGIYGMFVVITFIFQVLMFGMVFLFMTPRSAIKLHGVLVKATVKAPMSFFEQVDSSVLLNRFSQDMSLIDFQLPLASFMVFLQLANCIMAIGLISTGSAYMAATIPVAVVALYCIQKFYLHTSRQVRLLDLETKTPLYQHFTETLEGVATIRAFGWQRIFDKTALRKLDDSQRPYFLLYCIQRWLSLVLGLLVAGIGIILIGLALCVPQKSSGGALGVALTSILAFNQSLTMLISSWTDAETSLGSVARTASFEKSTPVEEEPEDPLEPDLSWPDGAVDVSGVGFAYKDGTTALKNVSFQVARGQKFGVVGRTGSGKSTLLSSFLRLIDPESGTITIDGIDISRVDRNVVRDRLICLPQDALVFPGTFRFNLDPEDRSNDPVAMAEVLKSVRLWTLVEKRGGLDADLKPESLSHGEQQLLALARAILRKQIAKGKCILILDEATSNLDEASEVIVQKVINEEFKDITVITVAHRLDTIKEADAVLMLDKGEVVRVGPPKEIWGLMGINHSEESTETEIKA
ncbi:P-loop containing nucleoside triphosphate hydrolase protein [Microthyrium microscopicum]|uniref:P-loop containing nucleoside triphosphate hydrolase protein n=1 Tax=Microthyrium microscopicum TaxID=703497 RepID=A0A6A6UHE2_9PEZI|nr:P-loop containing nucleoside triphosphate hydrolase protein [Microthyrium microscopicum]